MVAIVEETQFSVTVDGKDVSTRFASRLISLTTTDKLQRDRRLPATSVVVLTAVGTVVMPQKGAPIKIALGPIHGSPQQIFDGLVDDVRIEGTRGMRHGDRKIDGKSIDTGLRQVKRRKHCDNKTVGEAMKRVPAKTPRST